MTTIMAKPIMMLTAAVRPSAKRLNFDRNAGDRLEKMIANDHDQHDQPELVAEAGTA